ncbi:MAG: chemotaxis response regulator protein-glutamate methylesterase [Deltaproteobacteria bacterium]|nr:chemotaxis response regulator protein-glutamate methylesterase [Deltaproteobacteria bacterium]
MRKIRVLVIDDSAMFREMLSALLRTEPQIEVVGTAPDPVAAWAMIKQLAPDVLTLDVEMPRMDGLTFLQNLMTHHPLPVVMVSALTERGCQATLRALELGAIDVVTKPKVDVRAGMAEAAVELIDKVRIAAQSRVLVRKQVAPPPSKVASTWLGRTTYKIIAVGASTGGTEALTTFLSALPADAPGVVVVQHMPSRFTKSFAERLDRLCQIRVAEAADGDRVLTGQALIAPGGFHMTVGRSGADYLVRVNQQPQVNGHRPSVDVLFDSCAEYVGRNAVGVIMTGMGADGARGLLKMRKGGAKTFAQNEATCVVYGMPREAVERGAVDEVLPLDQLSAAALSAVDAN